MRHSYASIDIFLQEVFSNALGESGLVQQKQQSQGYLCPTARDLAVHLILELYDPTSTHQANIVRISSNLELAAEELLYLSRCIQAIKPS